MPGTNHCKEHDLSRYEAMTDEQLRQILRADAENTEGDTDIEQILCVMEVLAQRRRERNETQDPELAFKAFKKYYLEDNVVSSTPEKALGIKTVHWKRRLVAAAAALAILVGGAATARSFGYDVIKFVAQWTDETFSLTPVQKSGKLTNSTCAGLQETLLEHNITTALAPTWIPEGYELYDVKVAVIDERRQFFAAYAKGEDLISVQIQDYLSDDPMQIQQSSGSAEIYRSAGVDYYIFQDLERLHAAWINGNFECCISGLLTVEEMKTMIDSIAKG